MNIYIIIGIVTLIVAGCIIGYNKLYKNKQSVDIDWSFLMGASTDYCLLGHGNWDAHLELLSDYNFNMTRTFLMCGWTNETSGSDFKLYNGSDPNNINPVNMAKMIAFIDLCNSKGIIPMLSLFVTNGGSIGEGLTRKPATVYRNYIESVARAVGDRACIIDIINEEANASFIHTANLIIKTINKNIRTNGYKTAGCDYISFHTADKNYTSGRNGIQSNDTSSAILNLSDSDYLNWGRGAKGQGGHIEILLSWARDGGGWIGNDIARMKSQFGGALGQLKSIRED